MATAQSLKEWRELAGLKPQQMAERLGISLRKLYRLEHDWETWVRKISVGELESYAAVLGIPPVLLCPWLCHVPRRKRRATVP